MMTVADSLYRLYSDGGSTTYFGESVTTLEHSLQAAHFARESGATDTMVVAALLHDIGHLILAAPDDLRLWKADARHEVIGSQWLAQHFGPEVCEPVRLHVPAKRYLCTTDPAFISSLSSASVATLRLQGGPMSAAEISEFETQQYWREAIILRRWDDRGKTAGLAVPGLADYRILIEGLAGHGVAKISRH